MAELYTNALFSDANLVNYYRLEGNSTDAKDGDNGTDTDMTYGLSYGKFGQGASFNGSSSIITLASEAYIDTLSISAWVKPTAIGSNQSIFSHKVSDEVDKYFYINASGYLVWGTGSESGKNKITTATCNILTTKWSHVAITQASVTDVKLYVNGVLCTTSQTGIDTAFPAGSATRVIGSPSFFSGTMDDYAYFSRVLTQAEITSLFSTGGGKFLLNFV